MEAKLTIVIPVRNRAGVVGRTLGSVAAQTLRPLKVVLVDDGSTDSTISTLETFQAANTAPDFEVTVLQQPWQGAAAARNKGLETVTTPWVLFFDSDDTMAPEHCARAMEAADEGVDIVGWNTVLTDGKSRRICRFAFDHWGNIFGGGMATQRWCARTEVVRAAGSWNPACRVWDDIELGTRLIEMPDLAVAHIVGLPTVRVNRSAKSLSTTPWPQRVRNAAATMEIIAAELPEPKRHYSRLKIAFTLGRGVAEGLDKAVADDLMTQTMLLARNASERRILKTAYNLRRRVRRGALTILSPFAR